MVVPTNRQFSNGVTPVTGDEFNTFSQSVSSASALRQFIGKDGMQVMLMGIAGPGLGNGGPFRWNSNSTAPDDNYNVIVPTSSSTGAWNRVPWATGQTGATGPTGPSATGVTGATGPTGSGSPGTTGPTGPAGPSTFSIEMMQNEYATATQFGTFDFGPMPFAGTIDNGYGRAGPSGGTISCTSYIGTNSGGVLTFGTITGLVAFTINSSTTIQTGTATAANVFASGDYFRAVWSQTAGSSTGSLFSLRGRKT